MASKPGKSEKSEAQNNEAIKQNVKQNSGQGITGTAADPNAGQDGKASGHGGKVENDVNQTGDQKPTQKNEGKRTANSRHDRESHVGSSNQLQARRGATGH